MSAPMKLQPVKRPIDRVREQQDTRFENELSQMRHEWRMQAIEEEMERSKRRSIEAASEFKTPFEYGRLSSESVPIEPTPLEVKAEEETVTSSPIHPAECQPASRMQRAFKRLLALISTPR